MTINAKDGYIDLVRDKVENFHGNQLVYIGWDNHLIFSAAQAFPLPPEMPFEVMISEVMSTVFSYHPDFEKINWEEVEWMIDSEKVDPQLSNSLKENGIGHKSLIRFKTPGLTGINDTRN